MVRRKVARIGPSTLMISLPSKWCKHFNIQKGAELEVEEQGSEIRVRTNENKALMETTVDIRNLSERTSKWVVGMPGKIGYDIVNIKHDKDQMEQLKPFIKDHYIGFIISDINQDVSVLRKVSIESKEEFDPTLRRSFLVTLNLCENVTNAIKEKKFSNLKDFIALEITNNQLTNHCHRLLMKYGYAQYGKTCLIYQIAWNLEKIADEYKSIINCFQNQKNTITNTEVLEVLEEVKEMFKVYYELFYKFNLEKLDNLTEKNKIMQEKIKKWNKDINNENFIILSHSLNILNRLDNFSSSYVAVNLSGTL